jgi:hypothetical protein
MKEATGELNSTLIVVIAIAALSAIFFTIIWPILRNDLKDSAKCSTAVCDRGVDKDGMVYCYAPKNKNDVIYCPYKG